LNNKQKKQAENRKMGGDDEVDDEDADADNTHLAYHESNDSHLRGRSNERVNGNQSRISQQTLERERRYHIPISENLNEKSRPTRESKRRDKSGSSSSSSSSQIDHPHRKSTKHAAPYQAAEMSSSSSQLTAKGNDRPISPASAYRKAMKERAMSQKW
jgi:hypothetical protein